VQRCVAVVVVVVCWKLGKKSNWNVGIFERMSDEIQENLVRRVFTWAEGSLLLAFQVASPHWPEQRYNRRCIPVSHDIFSVPPSGAGGLQKNAFMKDSTCSLTLIFSTRKYWQSSFSQADLGFSPQWTLLCISDLTRRSSAPWTDLRYASRFFVFRNHHAFCRLTNERL